MTGKILPLGKLAMSAVVITAISAIALVMTETQGAPIPRQALIALAITSATGAVLSLIITLLHILDPHLREYPS